MRPAEMSWSSPKMMGNAPSKRSGHSFTMVNDTIYLFGGNDYRKPAGPNNELYKLELSSSEAANWTKIETNGPWPEPRSHHTATAYDGKLIIFGGFRSSTQRFNDVWIFEPETGKWSQPAPGVTELNAEGILDFKRAWPDVPAPRGSHSGMYYITNDIAFDSPKMIIDLFDVSHSIWKRTVCVRRLWWLWICT
jgi:hypothetical protein